MYMKILISESQFEKLIKKVKDGERFIKCDSCRKWFTQTFHKGKKSLAICPWCGRHNTHLDENQEVKEIDRYKFSELGPKYKKDDPDENYKEFMDVKQNYPVDKEVGGFVYHYDFYDEGDGNQMIAIYVTDPLKKLKVAYADFELRFADTFFITLPFVRPEYRKRGIALEIYKTILKFGAIASGKAQSDQAVGLWKKLMRELPNKVVFVDDSGREHDVVSKNNDIIIADTGKSVYGEKMGGYLKMFQS